MPLNKSTIIPAIVLLTLTTVTDAIADNSAGHNPKIQTLVVEAEAFSEPGGWVLCNQYLSNMGSPYLMAHGLGVPVEDAHTSVNLPSGGRWHEGCGKKGLPDNQRFNLGR